MTRAVVLGLALAAAAPAAAQTPAPAPARIGFVSFRDVLQRTPGYAAAESTFTREVEAYRQEVAQLQQQMDSAVQAFDQPQRLQVLGVERLAARSRRAVARHIQCNTHGPASRSDACRLGADFPVPGLSQI